jgi:hypothetical protein
VALPEFCRTVRFRVLDVARAVAYEINKLLGNRKPSLIHRAQLRVHAAGDVEGDVAEGADAVGVSLGDVPDGEMRLSGGRLREARRVERRPKPDGSGFTDSFTLQALSSSF